MVNSILMCQQLFHAFKLIYFYLKMKNRKSKLAKIYGKVANLSSKFSSRNITPDVSTIIVKNI